MPKRMRAPPDVASVAREAIKENSELCLQINRPKATPRPGLFFIPFLPLGGASL